MKDEYDTATDKHTGKIVPQFYPTNMEHIVDASIEYIAMTDENGEYPALKVRKLRNRWRFQRKVDESMPTEIEFRDPETVSPTTILKH